MSWSAERQASKHVACLESLRKHSSLPVEQHATCGPMLVSLPTSHLLSNDKRPSLT